MIKEGDANHNGVISFDEFVRVMTNKDGKLGKLWGALSDKIVLRQKLAIGDRVYVHPDYRPATAATADTGGGAGRDRSDGLDSSKE